MADYQDTILIRLTQKQVDLVNNMLKDFAIQNGKVKYSTEIPDCVFVDEGVWKYVEAGYVEKEELPFLENGNQNLTTYPKRHVKYGCEVPKEENYIYKIKHWAVTGDSRYNDTGLKIITDEQANEILKAIEVSSGSYQENDWVYSLTAEDNGRRKEGENNQTLDVHDRRIDDPNNTLEIAGSATIGMSSDPEMRSKFTIMGETEGQDGTVFGRLVDFYGEGGECIDPETGERFKGNIEDWGHLVPNENYPKVYMNRGEDRFNGEDWTDSYSELGPEIGKKITKKEGQEDIVTGANYGLGLGTIEATKEIVSHTTITADRGMIIEDGVGDPTDKGISKITTVDENGTPTDIQFVADGAPSHPTNQYALQIKHDGAKIQGHTHIFDETNKNIFKKATVNNETKIYYPKASDKEEDEEYTDKIISGCWFCEDADPHQGQREDSQYGHWCTNKDGKEIFVIDLWPGFLYHEIDKEVPLIATDPLGNEIYIYTATDGTEYCLEQDSQERYIKKEIVDESLYDSAYYRRDNDAGDNDNQYFVANLRELEKHFIPGIDANGENRRGTFKEVDGFVTGYTSKIAERVVPQTHRVYQIDLGYTQTEPQNRTDPICSDIPYPLLPAGTTVAANDYIYWDGTYFRIIGDDYPEDYNMSAGYGSLTIGTRAEGYKEDDTIGQHALEVGTNNEAVGDNSVAQGDSNYASAVDSHAEGLHTKVTGEFSHAEGVGTAGSVYREEAGQQGTFIYYGKEGRETEVKGVASHAEGGTQYIEGVQSHAEGRAHKILGDFTDSVHAEGSENEIQNNAHYSHAEGEYNIITENCEVAHAEGIGNVIDRSYQHLAGALAKTKHQVNDYYSEDTTGVDKPVIYAIGDGAKQRNGSTPVNYATMARRGYWKWELVDGTKQWVEYLELPSGATIEKVDKFPSSLEVDENKYYTYVKKNLFAVTEDGDTYVAGHLEVDGTSDLSGRATIGDSVADHSDANPALDVLKHSKFREKVTIERDGQATADLDMTWPTDDISLAVKGESLFGDTLTIGEAGDRDEETGTFWANLDESDPFNAKSAFNGLYVHGEIHNERIPQELYTSMPVGNDIILNEFADKFFVNSSIATSTATYRGSFSAIDYNPHMVEKITGSALTDILNNPDNYNIIECNNNLPTKYTNQLIFVQNAEKPIVFNLKKAWTVSIDIHPYEQTTYAIGYYRFYYNNNGVSQETPILDTNSKIEKSTWLKAKIRDMYNQTIEHKVNSRSDLPSPVAALENKIYYIIDEDTYCECIEENNVYKWIEIDPTANNNDYCYFQIWDRKIPEPYVLFAEQYDDDGSPLNSLPTQTEEDLDPEAEMEIICERYKFSETIHPTTGEIIKSEWKFEYQLNNSGFTQAQWAAINSGISGAWMSDIETRIANLNSYVHNAIEILQREDTKIWNNFNNYFTKSEIEQNYYNKLQLQQYLNENYYNKTQITNILASNLSNYYNKSQIDTKLQDYVNINTLNNYYTKAQIDSILDNYYTKSEIDPILNSYVTLDTQQLNISGKKNFTNSAGIGLDGVYLKKGNTSANVGPFTLPTSGSGELALKSDLDMVSGAVKNDFIVWNNLSRLEDGGGTLTFQKESKEIINGLTVYTGSCTIVAPLYSKTGNEGSNYIELYDVWKENNTQFYYIGGIVAEGNWFGKSMELETIEISNTNFTNARLKIKVPVNWAEHTGILVLYIHGIKFM